MKNVFLVISVLFSANLAAASQSYQCKTMGGPSRKVLLQIERPTHGNLVMKLKLHKSNKEDENFVGVFRTNRIWPDGGVVAESFLKGESTSSTISAVIQGSITPNPSNGLVYLSIGAGWDHRIEYGYGLHLSCQLVQSF